MKILYGVYPWAFDTPGGGERQLMAYYNHLKNKNFNIELYNLWNPKIKDSDIFHFFSAMPGSLQLCDYVKKSGLKLVISPNLWITEDTKHLYPFEDVKNVLNLADRIVVNSEMEAKELSNVFGINYDIFRIVYNGIEETFFERESSDIFKNKYNIVRPYILNIANIEPRKNQLNFLRALLSFPDVDLITIGNIRDKEYFDKCKKIAGKQFIHIESIEYASKLLKSALSGAEFFSMPSTLETPSIAALEAASSGLNVLITSEGSTKEYFKDTVTYIDPTNDVSIYNGIEILLKNKDKNFNISKEVSMYKWKNVVNNLKDIYIELKED